VLIIWLIIGIVLTYTPFNLQRRFLTGLFIPFGILSAVVISQWHRDMGFKKMVFGLLAGLSILSNLILITLGITTLINKDPLLFMSQSEYQAMIWIKQNSSSEEIVLASPQLSLFIPGFAERRVVYGHPFESLNAEAEKSQVEKFYKGLLDQQEEKTFLKTNQVQYIFFGPREKALGTTKIEPNWTPVYGEADVKIFKVEN
jgi:hypothetical protein